MDGWVAEMDGQEEGWTDEMDGDGRMDEGMAEQRMADGWLDG